MLQQQRQRLLDAYQAGLLTLDELNQRQNPLDLELQALQKRLAENPPPAPAQISLEVFTERIEHALSASEDETKQEVLRLLIERIVVSDEALTVEHIIPTVNESRLHPTHHAIRKRTTILPLHRRRLNRIHDLLVARTGTGCLPPRYESPREWAGSASTAPRRRSPYRGCRCRTGRHRR